MSLFLVLSLLVFIIEAVAIVGLAFFSGLIIITAFIDFIEDLKDDDKE